MARRKKVDRSTAFDDLMGSFGCGLCWAGVPCPAPAADWGSSLVLLVLARAYCLEKERVRQEKENANHCDYHFLPPIPYE